MIANFMEIVQEFTGSSYLLRAHGKGGARATILFLSVPPPEKSAGGFQQAGGGSGASEQQNASEFSKCLTWSG